MYSILVAALLSASPAAAGHGRIEDDFPRALAEAKAKDVPLVVDVWAPW
jgi:hypothetical protein